jgi:uncharacterized protein
MSHNNEGRKPYVIRVNLETVAMGSIPGTSLIILRPGEESEFRGNILPICVGPVEAACIGRALNPEQTARPMTHALLHATIAQMGGKVEHVSIDKVLGTVFYASITIKRTCDSVTMDARPSDAIALAVRARAPIFVDEKVMRSASFPAWVNVPKEEQKAMQEEFHTFVETLKPEDFTC